jgi:hypothetical protein
MKVRSIFSLATAVGLSVTSVYAESTKSKKTQPPTVPVVKAEAAPVAKPMLSNQDLADAVATSLKSHGLAGGTNISIETKQGTVILTGKVPSPEHGTKVLKCVTEVAGVKRVESTLEVTGGTLTRVSGAESLTQPMMPAPMPNFNPMMGNGMMPQMMPAMMTGGPGGAMPNEPAPLAVPNFPVYDPNGPVLPTNAWPTYAPYPNVSRVAYPEAYPYNAFPYIGPFYPFPKVPLGWRSVKLEWEDGHWYYGKVSTPHDYWRVRFW